MPVLDLCQLEHTTVAEGIDLESIWELKCSPWGEEGAAIKQRTTNLGYIDVSGFSWRDRYLHTTNLRYSSLSWKDQYLNAVANAVVDNSVVIHQAFCAIVQVRAQVTSIILNTAP